MYFIRKEMASKKETKLTYFEDHNLNSLYKRGQMCGKKMRRSRDVIQKYIQDQYLIDDKYRFRIRAYLFVATADPLVAFYHDGNVLLKMYLRLTQRKQHPDGRSQAFPVPPGW